MNTFGLHADGPFGGQGGSSYDARDGEEKVKHVDVWTAKYGDANYDVIGAIDFRFQNGYSTGRIGGRDPAVPLSGPYPFDFMDDEGIDDMYVFAGDGEGFVNGLEFHTNFDRRFKVGGSEGRPNHLRGPDLGAKGEWAGATGRDNLHGADAVVDNMILYFKE
ncbi:uncharacterized protein AKAW2_10186A [Aspergillus luchuensis]|uniref:Jacalin-type lectin domain-containing protein n=2 Tax=Aspergillus kawachii TaxID=1069201 RepID=A0A1M3TSV4_ASPLC|nr:uncharacterized protein AKAW2_10186A [Aspergillus luchuensis]OJZ89978.1 hypothetical protein ASPFODRAFT_43316 [Aspergillus luchuensis CBS 106.47]GAA86856.1 similar to An13g01660 [Aspergillus luchuensis IFO 4308]BCR93140.1 hypothetical protein AKAW2_10186A [Aspergillus luchuensis]BCS05794.1 hypothetical protein ALUC_10175A [Aspergillus luchuensis]GAT23024.1 similar to An13g01660 [Aspergillus luchuensis]